MLSTLFFVVKEGCNSRAKYKLHSSKIALDGGPTSDPSKNAWEETWETSISLSSLYRNQKISGRGILKPSRNRIKSFTVCPSTSGNVMS